MAYDDAAAELPNANWPQVSSGPLTVGGIMIGVGALVALAGFALAGTHVALATRDWLKELETPPDQMARLKWEQAKAAMAAGANSWQEHPNARVRMVVRRTSPGAD